MGLISLRRFSKGLWVTSIQDEMPDGSLRRASGVARFMRQAVQSRDGLLLRYALAAHSIARFAGQWIFGVGNSLYVEGEEVEDELLGNRITFARMAPTAGVADQLFLCAKPNPPVIESKLLKVSSDGVVTQWGIDPPLDGFTATPGSLVVKEIDGNMQTPAWDKTPYVDWGGVVVESITNTASGMYVSVYPVKVGGVYRRFATPLDLTVLDAGPPEILSMSTDAIQIRMMSGMTCKWIKVKFMTLRSGGLGEWPTEYASYEMLYHLVRFKEDELETEEGVQYAHYASGFSTVSTPKNMFTKNLYEDEEEPDWAQIDRIQFDFETGAWAAGSLRTFHLTFIQLAGGSPLGADYQYHITFRNSLTGTRSNANPTPLEVDGSGKGGILLEALPESDDPQVDQLEIWRTFTGGAVFFKCDDITDIVGTHTGATHATIMTDSAAEFEVDALIGMKIWNRTDGSTGIITDNTETTVTCALGLSGGTGNNWEAADAYKIAPTSYLDVIADYPMEEGFAYLQTLMLPVDNHKPFEYLEACEGPWNASMFWITRTEPGSTGRIYYSPVGRAEAVQGFIDTGRDDEPLQALVRFRGGLFAVSTARWYEVVGTNPYAVRMIEGAPGTSKPFTVAVTPHGICYVAHDGVRMFDGLQSTLVAPEPVQSLFLGHDEENLEAIDPTVGCYARGEYYLGGLE